MISKEDEYHELYKKVMTEGFFRNDDGITSEFKKSLDESTRICKEAEDLLQYRLKTLKQATALGITDFSILRNL